MTVVVAPAAAAQIVVRKRWWRANRHKAPERFDGELDAALLKIGERPESFPIFSASGGQTVRRCLLARTKCHLYFEIVPSSDEVWIVAVGGAVRRRGPRLSTR